MVHTGTFKLSQLNLDRENYRLGDQSSQRETIKAMIEDQDWRLTRIAKDITEVGLSPGEFIWVMPDKKHSGMFVVLEGNRRITTLKLLETPALADGTSVEKQFRNLAKLYAKDPIRDIEARVFADRAEASPWIRRRHMPAGSGIGLQRWKPQAQGRAMRDLGERAPRSLAVVELLQNESELWSEIAGALDDRWTTVDRVLNASQFPKILGITIDPKTSAVTFENGDDRAGKALLMRILTKMADPSFRFAEIETTVDRGNFVSAFAQWSVKKAETKKDDPASTKTGSGKNSRGSDAKPEKSGRTRSNSAQRNTLAPKSGSRTFDVDGLRLNPLYRECRLLRVKQNENAAAFLLRVFIELSSEALLIAKKVEIPHKLRSQGKGQWDDIGIPLSTKVDCVCDYLDTTKKNKTFQQARMATVPNSRAHHSVNALHGYFHNRKMIPQAKDLQDAWDAWESYLQELHKTLSATS